MALGGSGLEVIRAFEFYCFRAVGFFSFTHFKI